MEFADGKILAEIKDGVGRITFNQPAAQTNPGNPRLVATGTDLRIGLGPGPGVGHPRCGGARLAP